MSPDVYDVVNAALKQFLSRFYHLSQKKYAYDFSISMKNGGKIFLLVVFAYAKNKSEGDKFW